MGNFHKKSAFWALLCTAALALWTPSPAHADERRAQELPGTYGVKADRLDLVRSDQATINRRANHGRVFNSLTFRTNTASDLTVWFRVKEKISAERAVYAMCDGGGSLCAPRLRKWRGVLRSARHLSGPKLLKFMNRKVNSLAPYREDKARFGKKDYWASPLEFLDAGGDCEDFAILKYVSLIELGIPEENLHLVVVDDEKRQRAHALLTVQLAGKTFVLDSLEDRPLNHKKALRFKPLYSISGENRWIHVRYRRVAAR